MPRKLFLTELVSCRDEFHMELISTRHKFRERLFASLVSKQCFFCKIVLKIKLLSKIPLLTPLIQLSLIIQCCNGLMCDTCQTWNGWLHVHASCIPLLVQRIFQNSNSDLDFACVYILISCMSFLYSRAIIINSIITGFFADFIDNILIQNVVLCWSLTQILDKFYFRTIF